MSYRNRGLYNCKRLQTYMFISRGLGTKLSDATSPTRYDEVPADLGASALLQGMASKLLGL